MPTLPDDQSQSDSTLRFSSRVENYVRYRPGYPDGALEILADKTGLSPASVVADVGSGTGISSEIFLRNGNIVFAVEPNADMRRAAEQLLNGYPDFHSVAARAEATTLPDSSVDYVAAGQAFHWFEPDTVRGEFARILQPGGWVVLFWNARRVGSTPFLGDYERLLEQFGTDYREVSHRNVDVARLAALFHGKLGESFQLCKLYNEQRLDFDGLRGRLLSSSYTPTADHASYAPMLKELRRIFDEHAQHGNVVLEYDTEIYFGQLI